MTRLTFTLDDSSSVGVEHVRTHARELRAALGALEDSVGATEAWEFVRPVLESLDRLAADPDPSLASVVRESLSLYLESLRELELRAKLDAGYAALAADQQRSQMIRSVTQRAAERWADEP